MKRGFDRVRAWMQGTASTALNLFDAPVLVLLYHRVTTLAHDPQRLAVRPENFRRQLQWLKANYPLLRFEEEWRDARRPAVVLTFDDGYADNLREALPIIEEVGVPVTFFVSTGNLGTPHEFWWDEIERCVSTAPAGARRFAMPASVGERVFETATRDERMALYEALHPLLKAMPVAARQATLVALRAWAKAGETGRESHRPLAVDELRALAASPRVTIGAHTVTHTSFACMSRKEQQAEIETSRRQLETWIGRPVELFSYPFGGRADYDRASVDLCRAAGFRKAAANVQGNWRRWSDDFEIPRRLIRDWDLPEFAARIRRLY